MYIQTPVKMEALRARYKNLNEDIHDEIRFLYEHKFQYTKNDYGKVKKKMAHFSRIFKIIELFDNSIFIFFNEKIMINPKKIQRKFRNIF